MSLKHNDLFTYLAGKREKGDGEEVGGRRRRKERREKKRSRKRN